MQQILDRIALILAEVSGLQGYAITAISRDIEASVAVWRHVSKDLADEIELPILQDCRDQKEWSHMMTLVAAFGGQRIYIPRSMSTNHPISRQLGTDAAEYICKRYGSEVLSIPKAEELVRLAKDKAVAEDYDRGMSPAEIAQKYHIDYAWALRLILRGCKHVDPATLLTTPIEAKLKTSATVGGATPTGKKRRGKQ